MILKISLFKTLYANFKLLPFKSAIRFPLLISRNVLLHDLTGSVQLGKCSFGIVRFGFGNVDIFDQKIERSILSLSGDMIFEGRANFGHGSRLSVSGCFKVGDNFITTASSTYIVKNKVIIGSDVLISWGVTILDNDFHKIYNTEGILINKSKQISIGDHVWIGANSSILKGVFISNGSVIGTGSIVSKSLYHEDCIYAGSPAKLLKKNIQWKN